MFLAFVLMMHNLSRYDIEPDRLAVNSAGSYRVPRNWMLTPERTCRWADLDLWFLRSGEGMVETPDGIFPLGPGSCLIMRGGEPYTFRPNWKHPLLHYWVHFDCLDEVGQRLSPQEAVLPGRFHQVRNHRFLEEIIGRIITGTRENGRESQARIWLSAALAELAAGEDAVQQNQLDSSREKQIDEICHQIDMAPQVPWSVHDLAETFCSCRSHFYREFLARKGCSPQRYIIDTRMKLARTLLTESDNAISWIADQCGFHDIFFFSRQFKKHHGMSPSRYRSEGARC